MKNYIKSIIVVAALILCSTMAQAGKVTVITQVEGQTSTAGGTATVDKSSDVNGGETITITVTPSQGYYLNPADITVIKTINGSQAQARGLGFSEPLKVTHATGSDVTGTATYTFVMPETGVDGVSYDAEVTVNFSQLISITNATVTATGTFTYTGAAIVPETITVKLGETTLTVTTDYSLGFSDNINAGDATITATGKGKYTGTATGKFTINKANPVLTFSPTTASITFGNEAAFTKPTLTTTPEGLSVTYESKDTDKATVNATTGDITPVAAGENIEIKANFEGNDNYNSTSASYTLTVVKGTATVSKAPTAKELTYTGTAQALINAGEAVNGQMQYKMGADGTYSTDIPTGTGAKEYTVYYKVVATNANQYNDSEEASVTVTIGKADPVLTFDKATASITFGNESAFTKPTLTTTPAGLIVTYESKSTDKATVNATTGDITPVAAGENIEIKANFEGNDNYNSTSASYTLTVVKGTATVSKAPTAKELTYTGTAQALVNAGEAVNGQMQYKVGADGTYSMKITTGTDAKEYTVYYKAVATNANQYNDSEEASVTVTIGKADPVLTFDKATASITFGNESAFTKPTLTTTPAGLIVTYESKSTDKATVNATTGDITPVAAGENIEIKANFEGNDNYNSTSASYTLTVVKGTATVSKAPTAKELTYTGTAQALVNAGEAVNGQMQYKVGADGTYSTDIPTGTDAKEYTVYYKVVVTNANQYNDSEEASIPVTISKAAGTISFAEGSIEKIYGNDAFTNKLTIMGDGTVTYASSDETVAKVNATSGEVTITGTGKATITATVADGTNYTYETKTTEYALTVATNQMEVTAVGYTGIYDGEAHDITVTAPNDALVLYGITKEECDRLSSPDFIDAGNYTVYYKVTKANYATVTGSATVTISKATGSICYATASVNKTFGDEAFTNELTIAGDGTVSYASSDKDVATVDASTGEVTIAGAGSTTITATVADGTNYTYETTEATYTLTVEAQPEPEPDDMEVTAEGFTCTYDGEAHGITVNAPEGATITYSTDGTTYNLNASPTYTDAGTYTIYYQVTKDNYTTVTGSETVAISKAAGSISYDTASVNKTLGETAFTNELTITGDGTVSYTSSNEDVATVNATTGEVTIASVGSTTITATIADGTNYTYENTTASYNLTVNRAQAEGYSLWVGDIQVTGDNEEHILGEGNLTFIYNDETKTLLITNNEDESIVIESRMPLLNVYLNGDYENKLKAIYYNNMGEANNKGSLYITCYDNTRLPSNVTIKNDPGKSVIYGFDKVEYNTDAKLSIYKPEKTKYSYTGGQMMKTVTNDDGMRTTSVADEITITQLLTPIDKTVSFDVRNMQVMDKDGNPLYNEDSSPTIVNTDNAIVSDVLITLSNNNGTTFNGFSDATEDGDNRSGLVIETEDMTDAFVLNVAANVLNDVYMPGDNDFANSGYIGLTILLPAGYGNIQTDLNADPDYDFHILIAETMASRPNILGKGNVLTPFRVTKTTYCYIYLVKNKYAARTRMGKREKVHGKVYSVGVKVQEAKGHNPPSEASDGILPEKDDPELNNDDTDGIRDIIYTDKDRVGNDRWYNLNGQQIDEPTKKGLYIRNRKKIVVK